MTVDDVEAQPGDTINHALHPAAGTAPETVTAGAEYDARIDRFTEATENRLSIFYARTPETVDRTEVPTGTEDLNVQTHYRQEAKFRAGDNGEARLMTILFPHDDTHSKAHFERHSGDTDGDGRLSGVSISHEAGPVARIFESRGSLTHQIPGDGHFRGRIACFRAAKSTTPFFFVRRGRDFRRGAVGFSADRPVTIHLRGRAGRITAHDDTPVTLYHPDIGTVQAGEEGLRTLDSGDGWVRVLLPAGSNQPVTLTRTD